MSHEVEGQMTADAVQERRSSPTSREVSPARRAITSLSFGTGAAMLAVALTGIVLGVTGIEAAETVKVFVAIAVTAAGASWWFAKR